MTFYEVKANAGNKWDGFTVLDKGGAVDLTTATTIKLWLTNESTLTKKIQGGACSVEGDPVNGGVSYTPQSGDVDKADWSTTQLDDGYAVYEGEFEVEWATGLPDRFPSDGFFYVLMSADLEA